MMSRPGKLARFLQTNPISKPLTPIRTKKGKRRPGKMRILDSEIIAKEENVLIIGINAALDSGSIGKVFKEQYSLELIDNKALKDGDIVVFDNQIAFKLGFDAWVSFSLMLDRVGNFVGLTTQNDMPDSDEEETTARTNLLDPEFIKRREKEIIEAIAEPLDMRQIHKLFEDEFSFKISGDLKFNKGKMVVHDGCAVYKLNFDAQFRFYLLMDRAGNYLAITGEEDAVEETDRAEMDNTIDFSLSL
jgi:hypothetical protein